MAKAVTTAAVPITAVSATIASDTKGWVGLLYCPYESHKREGAVRRAYRSRSRPVRPHVGANRPVFLYTRGGGL
jgi:hypothetical protein